MKKSSTPVMSIEDEKNKKDQQLAPRKATIAFLRQFARAYRPAPAASMPGFILN